jgi:hypothetical protein
MTDIAVSICVFTLSALWIPLGLVHLYERWTARRDRKLRALLRQLQGGSVDVRPQHPLDEEGVPPSNAMHAMRMALEQTIARNRNAIDVRPAEETNMVSSHLKKAERTAPTRITRTRGQTKARVVASAGGPPQEMVS